MRDPAADRVELAELIAGLKASVDAPGAEAALARCYVLLARFEPESEAIPAEDVALLDKLHDLSSALQSARDTLHCPLDWSCVGRLEAAIRAAAALGVEVEPCRRLARAVTGARLRDSRREILYELQGGERPPSEDWKWLEYESSMARMREHGVDVSQLEAALERARYVEWCWARGVEPDMEDEEDEEDEDEEAEVEDDDLEGGEGGAPVAGGAPSREAPVADVAAVEVAASAAAPGPPAREVGAAGRALVEAHLMRVAALEIGDGGDTLRDLVWALLALGEDACVRVEGLQLALIEHLRAHRVLAREPSERAARAAIRKLVALSPIGERRSRLVWVYHLDMLRGPSDAFVAQLASKEGHDESMEVRHGNGRR